MAGEAFIVGLDEIVGKLDVTATEVLQGSRDGLNEIGGRIRNDAIRNLKAHGTTNTGELQDGIHRVLMGDDHVEVRSSSPHAIPVETGAAPHWAPIAPLKDWAREKLGDETAAYAVQAAIAKRGTKAQPYLGPAFDENRPKAPEIVAKAVKRRAGL